MAEPADLAAANRDPDLDPDRDPAQAPDASPDGGTGRATSPTASGPDPAGGGADGLADLDALDLVALHRRTSAKWRLNPPDVLPTFVAEMDYPLAAPIRRALHAMIDASDLGYPTVVGGYRRLPEAFAAWAAASLGWHPDPADVLMIPDVMAGVDLALRVGTAPGDGVVVNTPIYPPFLAAVADTGRTLVDSPLAPAGAGWVLDLDDLARRFAAGARAHLLCNPHNPTGLVATPAELARVLELAAEHDVLVVADEIHAPLTLPGARHTVAATLPEAAGVRLLTLTSASKAWNIPGLKCAVAVPADASLRAALARLPMHDRLGVSILGIEASAVAFEQGSRWLAAVLAHLDRNRWLLADLLDARLPEIGYVPPQATYLGWLDCRPLGLADPAERFLAAGRVAVGDGATFGPAGAGFVRVSFATSAAILAEIVDRMAAALR